MEGVKDCELEAGAHSSEGCSPAKNITSTIDKTMETKKSSLRWSAHYTSSNLAWSMLGGVGCGSILGVLARDRLTVWFAAALAPSGATGQAGVVISAIMANMFGCFVMGFCVSLRPTLQPLHPTIYVGLTTGFCGCCTTFSTYNTAVAMLLLRSASFGEGLLCAIVAIILGASSAWSSFMLGMSLPRRAKSPIAERVTKASTKLDLLLSAPGGTLDTVNAVVTDLAGVVQELQSSGPGLIKELPALPGKCIRQKLILYWSLLVTFVAVTVIVIALDPENSPALLMATLFAPLGAWLRYVLCKRNAHHRIPVYTLAANLFASAGSAVLGFFLDKSCGDHSPSGAVVRVILKGVSVGFCGSLSTVSTFVDDARKLGEQDGMRAFSYVAATLLGGQALAALFLVPAYISSDGCVLW